MKNVLKIVVKKERYFTRVIIFNYKIYKKLYKNNQM